MTSPPGSAALSHLQPVSVGVQEDRDVAPRELEDIRLEPHATRLQHLECLPAVRRLEGVLRRNAALERGSLPRRSWPEHQLELLALEADGQEPRSVGVSEIDALLEAEQVRVEVERPL